MLSFCEQVSTAALLVPDSLVDQMKIASAYVQLASFHQQEPKSAADLL
jgi:hypothetical protein